jgi:ATP-dependent RNA helicase DDX46/PRP5
LEKVKTGSAKQAGSGFGGKGLDRLDKERDDRAKAERKAYGEPDEEKAAAEKAAEPKEGAAAAPGEVKEGEDMTFGNIKVEVKRGPAPDSNKLGIAGAAQAARKLVQAKEEERIQASLRTAEEAAGRAGKDTPAGKQALSVVAKLNAQLRAHRLVAASLVNDDGTMKKTNPDSTEFHAVIPINDYPQKARWKVTNKETMVQLVDVTGASVTNKGVYYEPGKEPPAEGPQLQLLIEPNDEFRGEQAVREIKRLLIEASAAALQAEMRNPTQTYGRYSVV